MTGESCKKRRCTNPISRKNASSTTVWKTERSRDECRSRRNCASRNASCALFPRCFWNEPLPGTQVSTRIKGRVQCRDAFARSGLTSEANRRIGRSRVPSETSKGRESKNCDVSLSPDETSHFLIGYRIRIYRRNTRETRNVYAQGGTDRPSTSRSGNCLFYLVLLYRLVDVRQYLGKVCEEQTDNYDEGDERDPLCGSPEHVTKVCGALTLFVDDAPRGNGEFFLLGVRWNRKHAERKWGLGNATRQLRRVYVGSKVKQGRWLLAYFFHQRLFRKALVYSAANVPSKTRPSACNTLSHISLKMTHVSAWVSINVFIRDLSNT